jgi:hypothetical protein
MEEVTSRNTLFITALASLDQALNDFNQQNEAHHGFPLR